MSILKKLLMRTYGATEEEEERRTEAQVARVAARRKVRTEIHGEPPTADDYADWLNLVPRERNR